MFWKTVIQIHGCGDIFEVSFHHAKNGGGSVTVNEGKNSPIFILLILYLCIIAVGIFNHTFLIVHFHMLPDVRAVA